MNQQLVSCSEAGEILGLSPSTVKRLCDLGHLSSVRTPGGHRRILRSSLLGYLKRNDACALSQSQSSSNCNAAVSPSEILELMLVDDIESAIKELESYRAGHGINDLIDHLVGPMMHEVGTRWEKGSMSIYQEHLITDRLNNYLHRVSDLLAVDEHHSRAIGSAPEDDLSEISTKCIEICLRSMGWNAFSLGANLPARELAKAAIERRASIVWVTYTHPLSDSEIQHGNRELRDLLPSEVRLIVGGAALNANVRRQLKFDFAGDSMAHLCTYVSRLAL